MNNCDNLLSRDAALRLGLVKRLDNINDLEFGEVGRPVQCDPIKIRLRDDATPYSISTARRISLPLLPKVEQELQRMEENGVIERITEPTDWCAPIVPVMKKGGGVRICVDPKKLNRAVKREREIHAPDPRRHYAQTQRLRSWTRRKASGNCSWMTRRQS